MKQRLIIFTVSGLSLLGFVLVFGVTRWGIGTSPDSITYIEGARNLVAGKGFSSMGFNGIWSPITHFPPLYSGFLAFFSLSGLDPLISARWVNAILFAINIILVSWMLIRLSPPGSWLPVIGAAIFMASWTMIEIHLMAWSEAAFLALGLAGMMFLTKYIEEAKRKYLIIAGILFGCAFLTRYAGIALIGAGILGIMILGKRPLQRVIGDLLIFGMLGMLPLGLWFWRNQRLTGTMTSREIYFHPFGLDHTKKALTTLAEWFLIPQGTSGLLKLLPFILVFLLVLIVLSRSYLSKRGNHQETRSEVNLPVLVKLLALYLVIYSLFLVFSISFLDANTPLDGRILMPVFVCGLIVLLYFVIRFLKLVDLRIVNWLFFIVGLLVVSGYVQRTSPIVRESYQAGLGFTSIVWQNSETLAFLREYPKNVFVYTNAPEPFSLFTEQSAMRLPKKYDSANQAKNLDYALEFSTMKSYLLNKQSVLVLFYNIENPNLPDEAEILSEMPLKLLYQAKDGIVYEAKGDK